MRTVRRIVVCDAHHRFHDSCNWVCVKSTSHVDALIAGIEANLDDNGRDAKPIDRSEEFDRMYQLLGTMPAPEIHIKQEPGDITITGKTYPLSLFLEEIGFELCDGAYHPKDLLANFDELIAEVNELAAEYGWTVHHERAL